MHGGRPDTVDKVSNEDLFWRRHLAKDGKTDKDFEKPRKVTFQSPENYLLDKKHILLAGMIPA